MNSKSMAAKRKAIYIHGLGGSGHGSTAQNVRKMLEDEWSGKYEFSANVEAANLGGCRGRLR